MFFLLPISFILHRSIIHHFCNFICSPFLPFLLFFTLFPSLYVFSISFVSTVLLFISYQTFFISHLSLLSTPPLPHFSFIYYSLYFSATFSLLSFSWFYRSSFLSSFLSFFFPPPFHAALVHVLATYVLSLVYLLACFPLTMLFFSTLSPLLPLLTFAVPFLPSSSSFSLLSTFPYFSSARMLRYLDFPRPVFYKAVEENTLLARSVFVVHGADAS